MAWVGSPPFSVLVAALERSCFCACGAMNAAAYRHDADPVPYVYAGRMFEPWPEVTTFDDDCDCDEPICARRKRRRRPVVQVPVTSPPRETAGTASAVAGGGSSPKTSEGSDCVTLPSAIRDPAIRDPAAQGLQDAESVDEPVKPVEAAQSAPREEERGGRTKFAAAREQFVGFDAAVTPHRGTSRSLKATCWNPEEAGPA